MQYIPIVENVCCHYHEQFHLSHVTVADPDSSDSNRLYPNEPYRPTKCLLSVPKEVFTSKRKTFGRNNNMIMLYVGISYKPKLMKAVDH